MLKKSISITRFVPSTLDPMRYDKWLKDRAKALRKRDLKREVIRDSVSNLDYKRAIHRAAVFAGEDKDYYTGESIEWELLKVEFVPGAKRPPGYPVIDHICPNHRNLGKAPKMVICREDTNNWKSNLTVKTILEKVKSSADFVGLSAKLRRMEERGLTTTNAALIKHRGIQRLSEK